MLTASYISTVGQEHCQPIPEDGEVVASGHNLTAEQRPGITNRKTSVDRFRAYPSRPTVFLCVPPRLSIFTG
ncbi:predicted protein [Plenodomus lingam JN3]|uniref:Predicted protein n=1 Tax=Leptosphaeria maculans (strain JN3 / isolate v23.1.3 / race Av1-4-5-6-7-8) TaxID=985895 RepID=E5A3T0_LEPMJ|nr:predicted protein [Plenodomus lingam JN3]CBX98293.1 predicted protein [Plenodomus lingam JN3]